MGRPQAGVTEDDAPGAMTAPGVIPIDRRAPASSAIVRLKRQLLRGRLVVLPTETQYALSADATNKIAVELIRRLKGRSQKPFSVFLPGLDTLPAWGIACPPAAVRLANAFWPGPLTLILSTDNPMFGRLGGSAPTVGVRVSPEPIVALVLARTARPLVATSANPSGRILTPEAENQWLGWQAAAGHVLWARPLRYGRRPASTVIDLTGSRPRELRAGAVSADAWSAVL